MAGQNKGDPYDHRRDRPTRPEGLGDEEPAERHAHDGAPGGTGFGEDGRGQTSRKGQAQSPAELTPNEPPKKKEGHH